MTLDENPTDPLALDPLYIPGLVTPIQTPGADGGVNLSMLTSNAQGLLVTLQAYQNMRQGDWVEVFWGDDIPVAADTVLPEQVDTSFPLFIAAAKVPEGIHDLYARVTREGSGNQDDTLPLSILVRTLLPGGFDPEPGTPGHQNLLPPEAELPPSGIIDEDAAEAGIKVTIPGYPNIREFDTLTFSWGGVQFTYEVTAADVHANKIELLVTEETILAAGSSDALTLTYWLWDEVHNLATDWSMPAHVIVEIGQDLFDAPMIENPDPVADPYDVIDLDDLGDDDLLVNVMAYNNGLLIGDLVTLTWTGTTAQGLPVTVTPEPQEVTRHPQSLPFIIPNADLRVLGQGRGVASYTVSRDGNPAGVSKRAFVSFIGVEEKLPPPRVEHAVEGALDPALAQTSVIIPGEALEAGDIVYLTWLGTRANGSTLLHEDDRSVSGGGAGQPMTFSVDGAFIAPLEGGTLAVYYRVYKRSIGMFLESEHERLSVGESHAELPAPTTLPPVTGGVLDPTELPGVLEIVVPHWPGMNDKQTVHLVWRASGGANYDDFMPISAPMLGKDVAFFMDRGKVEEYLGKQVQLSYWVETPGEASQVSGVLGFSVAERQEIGEGPFRVMGARSGGGVWTAAAKPKSLVALHDQSPEPMLVEWCYEGESVWTAATRWIDRKPWLKLYARNRSETWACNPLNIVGTALQLNDLGKSAFVAMRDEVLGDSGVEVDLVAWGHPDYGGTLESNQVAVKDVAQICSSSGACAARLRSGNVICWGDSGYGGTPRTIYGDFEEIVANGSAFVGRKADGELYSWGNEYVGVPVPDHVLQYKDYRHLYAGGGAFAALRENSTLVVWGHNEYGGQFYPGQEDYDGILDVVASGRAFAALRRSGTAQTVFAWGHDGAGGVLPEEITRLTNVASLAAATSDAFCIQLESGELKVWPATSNGGELPQGLEGLKTVIDVSATFDAFCALLSTGQVVAWGRSGWGGSLPEAVEEKTNIIQVVGATMAFAALCSDGTVVAWGDPWCGGNTGAVAGQLVNVRAIYSNGSGFTALTQDGRVVTWGVALGGGDSSRVQSQLRGKVTHSRLLPPGEAAAMNLP